MITIHKYPLHGIDSAIVVELPRSAQVLTVQVQNGVPCLWARVNTEEEMEARSFRLIATGADLEQRRATEMLGAYVGTVQLGMFVFHVFEVWQKGTPS